MRSATTSTPSRETIEQRLHRTGIARLTARGGFRYRCADGRDASAADRRRIQALVIPPAWTDVRIAPSADDLVQAIGRDQRGRLQYRYHESQTVRRERDKLQRILRFAAALPRLRAHVERDLRRRGLGRERVLAAAVRVLGACYLRPGSATYAKQNGSFGIATLQPRHVHVRGAIVGFDFPAKSGKRARSEMRDARVATVIRDLLRTRAKEVFAYEVAGRGRATRRLVDVRRRDVNAYLAAATGERITAKDFRTWAGTLVCASALAGLGDPAAATRAHGKRAVAAALRQTAEVLGNTPAVCRKSYVFGAVLDAFDRGQTVRPAIASLPSLLTPNERSLPRLERAVTKLLLAAMKRHSRR